MVIPKFLGLVGFSYWQLFLFYTSFAGFFHFGISDGVYLQYGGVAYRDMNKSLIGSQFWLLVTIQTILLSWLIGYSAWFVGDSNHQLVLDLTACYMVLANMNWYLGFVFQATNQTRIYSFSVIIERTFFIASVILLLFMRVNRVNVLMILYLFGQLLSLSYSIFKGRAVVFARWLEFRKTFSAAFINAKIGINLMLSSIASILTLGYGRFLVEKLWGVTIFGKMSFALSLTNFFLLFIGQVSIVLFPALRMSNDDQLKEYYNYIRNSLGLILPMALLIYVPLRYFLGIWLPHYQESFRYLVLLLPMCTFDGKVQLISNTYLKVLKKEKAMLGLNFLSMILSLILSSISAYIFHSIYFIMISMVISIAFRSIISEIYLSILLGKQIISSLVFEVLLAVSFMVFSWYLSSTSSFILFLTLYIIFLILNKEKIKTIFKITMKLFSRNVIANK